MQNLLGLPWTEDFDPSFSNLQRSSEWPIHRMHDHKRALASYNRAAVPSMKSGSSESQLWGSTEALGLPKLKV